MARKARAGLKVSVSVAGAREIVAALENIDKSLSNKIVKQAVTKATTPLLRAVRKGAPVGPKKPNNPKAGGLLKKSVTRKVASYKQTGTAAAVVGTAYLMAPHDHLVHEGTKKRVQKTRNRQGFVRGKGQK
ncbi:MAG: HK97 gp10 family phage protein, partial [Acidobacteriales bacterium]|nr:HK97 gp10 family phage protein [Terriglobales bacterium]